MNDCDFNLKAALQRGGKKVFSDGHSGYFTTIPHDEGTELVLQAKRLLSTLSRRESQVAILVASGHSNKEISKILGISVKTIEKHRSHAIDKCRVGNSFGLTSMVTLVTVCAAFVKSQPDLNEASSFSSL